MRALALLCGLTTALLAQDKGWGLPPHSALEFERKQTLTTRVLETKEQPPPGGENPDLGIFRGLVPAPVLLAGELDKEQRIRSTPPVDLRDLANYVAFDLRKPVRGKVRYVLPLVPPFGDVIVQARCEQVAADGMQKLVADVSRVVPEPGDMHREHFAAWVAPHCTHDLVGTLTITRHLDAETGFVDRFTAELAGTVTYPQAQARRRASFRIDESWQWQRLVRSADAALKTRVHDAIRLGSRYVKGHLENPAMPELGAQRAEGERTTYGSGRLALAILTVLKAEEDPNDKVVQAALDELRRREVLDTYSLALAIMAVEAAYAPSGERQALLSGQLQRPLPRKPSAADRKLLQAWTDRLLANTDQRVDKGYRLRWSYVAETRYDNSNTQYALLGLWSAHLCGIEIPAGTWLAAANHFLHDQRKPKPPALPLQLVTYHELERAADAGRTVSAARRVEPAGWSYIGEDTKPAYSSMTCAGLTGLTICGAILRETRRGGGVLPRIDKSIEAGFAWLAEHFTLRSNPGYAGAYAEWPDYHLYSLERACELSRIALLQDRDWYFEGTMLLLPRQLTSGEFAPGRLESTCFGVLFLKKAALPVVTGGR